MCSINVKPIQRENQSTLTTRDRQHLWSDIHSFVWSNLFLLTEWSWKKCETALSNATKLQRIGETWFFRVKIHFAHFSGGKSVEYNSTFVSASRSALIPRAQMLLSQYLHSNFTTVLLWNAGWILLDILQLKRLFSVSFWAKAFVERCRVKMAVL